MSSNLIIYETQDGQTKLQVKLEDETVWLNQEQMGILFGKSKKTINEHIKNIYAEGEQKESQTLHKSGKTRFQQKQTNYYNLDMIISVGYRVKSQQGTQFRIWATERLKEYIVKGFTMDDDRLKQEGAKSRYFEELLQRVRDIRSSERNFYQKITDIYTTAIDYKSNDELTKQFFATVQNKIHYAIHGNTAAEVIKERVDSEKEFMGLTNFKGNYITTRDIGVAKNYLTENELKQLNLIVSMYLDFAELQAMNMEAMTMQDWINKLDDFLKTSGKELLDNAGSISHKEAKEKAKIEYEKYRKEEDKNYISDFDKEVKKLTKKKE
ncbi:MAG TPA: virulence RhuM family protein [Candidatus Absconditabacterales bacterium]|nr:virulence RhuM family protein [Candidatus Absconditabacterales bacterium]